MNEKVNQYIEKGTGYWQNLETNQKIKIGATAVFILTAFILLSVWAMTPEYTSIVTNVADAEMGEIVAELENLSVPYKLEGNSILVPSSQAIKARYDLAASGYPKEGSIDYGIFTDTGFGMTKDQFSILKKGALEGELEKTIKKLSVIEDARVHLNIPEQTVWVRETTDVASAAIYVDLRPGVSLDETQILGIEQLVTMSVPGIERGSVVLIDQNGRRLEAAHSSDKEALNEFFDDHVTIKSQIEAQLQKSIRNHLEQAVGTGNVLVDAVAKVNFNKQSRIENLVTPVVGDEGIIISSQTQSESSTTGTNGGVPGYTGNDPATYENAAGQQGTYERSDVIENREVNRIHIETVSQPYQIEDVSISIILNQREDQPIADDLLNNVTRMVQNVALTTADNLQSADDVKVSVMAYPFDTTLADQLSGGSGFSFDILYIVGALLAGLIIAGVIFAVWRRRNKRELAEMAEYESQGAVNELIPRAVEKEVEDLEYNDEGQQMRKQLEKLARQKPEDFTKLLRTWLMDD